MVIILIFTQLKNLKNLSSIASQDNSNRTCEQIFVSISLYGVRTRDPVLFTRSQEEPGNASGARKSLNLPFFPARQSKNDLVSQEEPGNQL
ncbi:hypothetical protein [Tychonema sp. LEGE 07203]|uniref:hypothetical protein n=1 Tax=Tychonema sp. LEGE 07203 TaxID=1828671 RepID=UPI0018827EBE|nr:hypothetical protein [Tychonema sp. LEGE 07203]MBE9095261.1 hypothetical protein [Tychonema sp. LEGE 07203]